MRISFAPAAVLWFVLSLAGAAASDLADFHAAVETAAAHNRVALGYLRTGNNDLAAIEVERMRDAWKDVASRFGRPPDAFAAHRQLYTTTMLDVSTRLVTATMMLDTGRPAIARDALLAIRNELSDLRKAAGVTVLADCIRDANAAMDALYVFNNNNLNLNRPGAGNDIADKAAKLGLTLKRCDRMADDRTRASPEFRRLVDGALASIELVAKAIDTRDAGLLHRLLIELRSFDNLLAFRYG